ncbi:MAG: histidine phosphatase family protein [Rhodobacteraceae bacterium]|nr:histidine phosphatase family protein [Paracoccaceae bacterium]MCF8514692.1 histidine phosphatase family protein [Paracoccaceae bacterium]MCF8518767.1 histidine phosphatase family protein [Paracoccaceae bacterium]
MTRLWWVRHGPTHSKAFAGWRDIPADLSDAKAIARLNAHLPHEALLVSSDLIRATATADAIGAGRTRLPHRPSLREFHFGDWDGMIFTEVAARWPTLSRQYWEEPGHVAPPNGESWIAAEARVNADVAALLSDHPADDIIIVAHFGVILTQVQRGLGVSPYEAMAHSIDNLSVTRLDHDGTGWSVQAINHLP